jgi:hypothetical protein
LLAVAAGARGSTPPPEEQDWVETTSSISARCQVPHPGKTTQDSEVVFGRFAKLARARTLLRRVRRSGFHRARIEREDCIYEVAVIFLTKHRAQRIARKAHKAGWQVRIMVS